MSIGCNLYPNPATDFVTIELTNILNNNVLITISDEGGKIVYNRQFNETSNTINKQLDVSGFSKGMYFVQIQNGPKVKYTKFIKF